MEANCGFLYDFQQNLIKSDTFLKIYFSVFYLYSSTITLALKRLYFLHLFYSLCPLKSDK